MNRRDFLQYTAAVAAGPLLAPPASQPWFDKPMRWAQLTLAENDPGTYDPAFWLDYFRRTHSDAAFLSAGGCVAYYPTKIPLHHRSLWMGDSDPFGELVTGCRKLGMNVIARTDPHATYEDVYDAHPDWIAVDASGNKRRHWASPELWVTCALGPYNFKFMTAVTREIVERYQVDGIFSNRWEGSGMCYCEHCQANFEQATGFDLPRTSNPLDPARRAFIVWKQQRLFELWRLWDAAIRRANPNAAFIANAGGGALSWLDMKTIGELAPTLFADRQARNGVAPPWTNGKNGKEYRATLGRKAIVGIFSVGIEEPYRWKDSVQTPEEIRLWVVDGIANGLRPWFTKFSGVLYDGRWLKSVEELYGWHYRNESYLRNEQPLARMAMVYSQQTATFYGGDQAKAKVEDHTLGFYQALVEARIPFEMVHDRLLDAGHTDQFRTLILPNIAALSSGQCTQLRQFVERGGSLVATYETSLYDEWGVRRGDFGLADLFGLSATGPAEGPLRNSYLNIEKNRRISSAARGPGRCGPHHQRCSPYTSAAARKGPLHAADAHPVLPGPAHGKSIPARAQNGYSGSDGQANRQRPRCFLSMGHRPNLLGSPQLGSREAVAQCGAVGNERRAGSESTRGRPSRCHGLDAEAVPDGALGEPIKSHDDERTRSRDHPDWSAESSPAASVREDAGGCQAAGRRNAT